MSQPKIRGYRKRILSLWLQKGMFWVSEPRLVDQAELEIEELERKVTGSDSVIVEEARSVEALPDHVGEGLRNVLLEMGAEEQDDTLDEEAVAIIMELADVIERGKKDKLPALRIVPNFRHWERLERKYSIRVKKLNVVIEELKQDYCYCSKS